MDVCLFSLYILQSVNIQPRRVFFQKIPRISALAAPTPRAPRLVAPSFPPDTSPVFLPHAPDPISRLLRLPATEEWHTSLCLPQSRAWHAFEQ
jgi:hypothetical protein